PLSLVLDDRRRAVTFAQPLLVGTQNQRYVRELGHLGTYRAIEQDLFWRIRNVIVATNDVRDRHVDIVRNHGQLIGGMTVRTEDDEVFDVGAVELDGTVN